MCTDKDTPGEPSTHGAGLDTSTQIVVGGKRSTVGCPCFMDLGTETICINGDQVRPVSYVRVQNGTPIEIDTYVRNKSTSDRLECIPCCATVDVGSPDGYAYCTVTGEPLVINGRQVRSADIEDALQFVLFSGAEDAETCSPCIYKYLVTIGGFFEHEMGPEETRTAIEEYLRFLARDTGARRWTAEEAGDLYKGILRSHLHELAREKRAWSELAARTSAGDISERVRELLNMYRSAARIDMILHAQLLTLWEDEGNTPVSAATLRDTAKKIVGLCGKIHQVSDELLREAIPEDIRRTIRHHQDNRRSLEERVQVLLEALDHHSAEMPGLRAPRDSSEAKHT